MLGKRINKRLKIIKYFIFIVFTLIGLKLINIQVFKHEFYLKELKNTEKIVYSLTAPRGRIYDRNGILLVDNEPIKVIRYSKLDNDLKTEKEIANKLAKILEVPETDNKDFKNKKAATIYERMNNGYYYDVKTIKENATEEEYALIAELDLKGIFVEVGWKRIYKYDAFKTMLGTVGSIPAEKLDYYLDKGYSINDKVGISYIEEIYDDILKGEKSKYIFEGDEYKLLSEGAKGNDIYLTIDINLQKEVEEILEEQIKKAKNERNTKYYDHSYVIVSEPNTGEILAMAGKKYLNGKFTDYTSNLLTSTVTAGSAIKGASHIVGYKTGSLEIGEKRKDFCIKIRGTEAKCSWRKFGTLNDLTALKYSSNSYQFQTAIKLGNGNYVYNKSLTLNKNALEKYRSIFAQFGLGTNTGIDFFESTGYKGSKKDSGLILDFAIGQYDTYTPVQLSQYINTIATSGSRFKLQILKGFYENQKYVEVKPQLLNKVNIEEKYLNRVQEGFKMVMESGGTGYNYISNKYKPAGKTGTSTSYIDTNNDNKVDTATATNTFVAYAPFDNPIVTFTVISPNVRPAYSNSSYKTSVNQKISYEVSRKFFEIYK